MIHRPDGRVLSWLSEQTVDNLFLASLTIGELVPGARRLQDAKRRGVYERWIENDLASQFKDRILPFDRDAAVIWGEIISDGDRSGRTGPAADAQIAAVARRHILTLPTRNIRDFEAMAVMLLDPWSDELKPV